MRRRTRRRRRRRGRRDLPTKGGRRFVVWFTGTRYPMVYKRHSFSVREDGILILICLGRLLLHFIPHSLGTVQSSMARKRKDRGSVIDHAYATHIASTYAMRSTTGPWHLNSPPKAGKRPRSQLMGRNSFRPFPLQMPLR